MFKKGHFCHAVHINTNTRSPFHVHFVTHKLVSRLMIKLQSEKLLVMKTLIFSTEKEREKEVAGEELVVHSFCIIHVLTAKKCVCVKVLHIYFNPSMFACLSTVVSTEECRQTPKCLTGLFVDQHIVIAKQKRKQTSELPDIIHHNLISVMLVNYGQVQRAKTHTHVCIHA